MHWKQSPLFFAWQSIYYAQNLAHFKEMLSYFQQWKQSFKPGRNSISDEQPWINFIALHYISQNLRSEYKVFEFGGGGSTLFFCKKVAEVVTVEHDPEWFKILNQEIENKGYKNWKGNLKEPVEDKEAYTNKSPENPLHFISGSRDYENFLFTEYAKSIGQYPENYFDIILVDGRARPSCFYEAISHLKRGGLLIFDNTDRKYYRQVITSSSDRLKIELDLFGPVAYTGDFTRTTVLRRI